MLFHIYTVYLFVFWVYHCAFICILLMNLRAVSMQQSASRQCTLYSKKYSALRKEKNKRKNEFHTHPNAHLYTYFMITYVTIVCNFSNEHLRREERDLMIILWKRQENGMKWDHISDRLNRIESYRIPVNTLISWLNGIILYVIKYFFWTIKMNTNNNFVRMRKCKSDNSKRTKSPQCKHKMRLSH